MIWGAGKPRPVRDKDLSPQIPQKIYIRVYFFANNGQSILHLRAIFAISLQKIACLAILAWLFLGAGKR